MAEEAAILKALGSCILTVQQKEEVQRCLLDLPERCLHLVAQFMDAPTMLSFFQASKGHLHKPGCAVLILAACKPKLTVTFALSSSGHSGVTGAVRQLLHFASQASQSLQLVVKGARHDVEATLGSLLLFTNGPSASIPLSYPGVTKVVLQGLKSKVLIPSVLLAAFPNLHTLEVLWTGVWPIQLPGRPLKEGVGGIRHLKVKVPPNFSQPAARQVALHVCTQLSAMSSLTTLDAHVLLLSAATNAVLGKLSNLRLHGFPVPDGMLAAATHLTSLQLCDTCPSKLQLSKHVTQLRELHLGSGHLSDELLSVLLALPHLSSLTASWITRLHQDWAQDACAWSQIRFTGRASDQISRLPLHALDAPITCACFSLRPSSAHLENMAAIQAAKPHLLRCGGVRVQQPDLDFDSTDCQSLTQEEVGQWLSEWVACLPAPVRVRAWGPGGLELIRQHVARLWPQASVRQN